MALPISKSSQEKKLYDYMKTTILCDEKLIDQPKPHFFEKSCSSEIIRRLLNESPSRYINVAFMEGIYEADNALCVSWEKFDKEFDACLCVLNTHPQKKAPAQASKTEDYDVPTLSMKRYERHFPAGGSSLSMAFWYKTIVLACVIFYFLIYVTRVFSRRE